MESVRIKNVVCRRCIKVIEDIFEQQHLPVKTVELGVVWLESPLTDEQKSALRTALEAEGFELIEDKRAQIVNQIKDIVIEIVHHNRYVPLHMKLSDFIAQELHHDYSYLSHLFSSLEGITLEKYIIKQKIERVKELLLYDELTLSEIAFQLGYSSTQHLSSQFKRVTGFSPSIFKTNYRHTRKPLDKV